MSLRSEVARFIEFGVDGHDILDHMQHERDRRFRYVALFVVAAIALLIFACAPAPRAPHVTNSTQQRDEVAQMRGTVLIEQFCLETPPFTDKPAKFGAYDASGSTGSGTIIDEHHVLTAAHVIDCKFVRIVRINTYDGRHILARVDRYDHHLDLARLAFDDPIALGFIAPTIGTAKIGNVLCTSFAYPFRGTACGSVKSLYPGDHGDNIVHDARTEHGNSGGGVFIGGELVGVVTRLAPCDPSDPWLNPQEPGCGGEATALAGVHTDWFTP